MNKIEELPDFKSELREILRRNSFGIERSPEEYVLRMNTEGVTQTIDDIIALFIKQLPEEKPNNETSGVFNHNGVELGAAGYNNCLDDIKSMISKE